MSELARILITTLLCIPAGILLGNSAVYIFNNMPAKWLCDYGEEPSEEKFPPGKQRLTSHPWKPTFSALFAAAAVFLCNENPLYGAAALVELWLLLMIALSDKKYMIIPDQFVVFLALSAVGMANRFGGVTEMLWGMLLGGGAMLAVALLGRLITKNETLGFGDVKLMAAIGLSVGLEGTAFVLIASSLFSCAAFTYMLVRKKVKRREMQPLGPYIAAAAALLLIVSV